MAFMLTPKESLLETLKKDGKPECLCNSFTMFGSRRSRFKLIRGNRIRGTNSYDQWNLDFVFRRMSRGNSLCYRRESGDKDVAEWKNG